MEVSFGSWDSITHSLGAQELFSLGGVMLGSRGAMMDLEALRFPMVTGSINQSINQSIKMMAMK
jgi:hypothetical protein